MTLQTEPAASPLDKRSDIARSGWGFTRKGSTEQSLSEVYASIPIPCRRLLVSAAAGIFGAGLHGVGRLHGPGQLGDRLRRRLEVRLHAARGHHDLESDGHPAAGAGGAARHRQRARSGAGLPRRLSAPGRDRAVDRLRTGDHRLRPRRSHRHRHRAQAAVRHSAGRRRADHGARCLSAADADEQGLPFSGSLHHRAAGRHRDLFPGADRAGGAAGGRAVRRFHPVDADRDQSGDALHRHRHHRRHRDAAQSLSAFLHRADATFRARRRRQAPRHPLGDRRQHHRADAGAVRQRRDPDRRRRRLPRPRQGRGGDRAGLCAAVAAARGRSLPRCCLPSRSWLRE